MYAQAVSDGFDLAPAFDLRRIWTRRERAIQPTVEPETKATALIRDPRTRRPEGMIYRVPDGRLFYVPLGDVTGRLMVNDAERILYPSHELFSGSGRLEVTFKSLGPLGEKAGPEVQKMLLVAFYGKRAASEMFSRFSLV
jgi:hypothetical protein